MFDEEEVDERQDKSLMENLRSLVQHRGEMPILEASRGANEPQVFQSNCLYECVFASLEEYEDEQVQEASIKEKEGRIRKNARKIKVIDLK
jgi:hypothetical protein